MTPAFELTLTDAERQLAVERLQATKDQFLATFQALSEAQWNFKIDDSHWSPGEIAEHIATSELLLLNLLLEKVMNSPVDEARAAAVRGKEKLILKAVTDRSTKVQAPGPMVPSGRWGDPTSLMADYVNGREAFINFVSTSTEAVRGRVYPHPFFQDLDVYQWILFSTVHNERHFLQLAEVQAHPDYPA